MLPGGFLDVTTSGTTSSMGSILKLKKNTRNAGRQVSAESTQRFLILKLLLLARKYECIVS